MGTDYPAGTGIWRERGAGASILRSTPLVFEVELLEIL